MKDHLLALEIKEGGAPPVPEETGGGDVSMAAAHWSVSVLILKPSMKGMVLIHALTLKTAPFSNSAFHADDLDDNSFDDFLERLGENVDLSTCSRAVVTIPASMASYRHMDLPFRSRRKIRQVLSMELEAMLPLSDEEVISDFIYTGRSISENHTFFTASLSRSIVDALRLPLTKRGMTPVLISLSGYLTAHLVLDAVPKSGFFLLVAVQSRNLVINAVLDGVIVGLRSIVRGNDNAALVADTVRSLVMFQQRLAIDNPLDACHLMGDDDDNGGDGLGILLEKALATSVVHADLSSFFQCLERSEIDVATSRGYLNAFAAARCMGRPNCLDFCRSSHGPAAFFEKYMSQLVVAGLLVLTCFCLVVSGEYMEIRSLKKQSAAIDRQARLLFEETFPEVNTIVDPYMQMTVQVRQTVEQSHRSLDMGSRFAGDHRVMDLFFELSSRIPDTIDMEISRLVFNEGRMIISGTTDTYDSVDKVKTAIESSPLFTDVKIGNAAADKNDKRIRFKFIFQTTAGDEHTPVTPGRKP